MRLCFPIHTTRQCLHDIDFPNSCSNLCNTCTSSPNRLHVDAMLMSNPQLFKHYQTHNLHTMAAVPVMMYKQPTYGRQAYNG